MYSKLKKSFIKSAFFIGLLGYNNIALSSFSEDSGEGTSAICSVKPFEFEWTDSEKTELSIKYHCNSIPSDSNNTKDNQLETFRAVKNIILPFLYSQRPHNLKNVHTKSIGPIDKNQANMTLSFINQAFYGSKAKVW